MAESGASAYSSRMRVDAHQHFWRHDPVHFAWIDDSMAILRRDFLPEDLEPLLAAKDLDACVAVQATTTDAETDWLLDLAEAHDFIRGVVGWADLRSSTFEERLGSLLERPKLVGLRHVVQSEPDERFLLREDFARGVEALGQAGLTYDLLIYPRQLPAAIAFADRHEDLGIVLDHLAKPEIRSGRLESWTRDLRELARRENVFCKISGLVTEADWTAWRPEQIRSCIEVGLEAFGPARLMIGSDWPVCTLAAGHDQVIDLAESAIGGLSARERAAIAGENARRFYGL